MYTSVTIIIDCYRPEGKRYHSSIVIGNKLYHWGGRQPRALRTKEKTTNIDVLHLDTGIWSNKTTTGDPHPGVRGYACTAIENKCRLFFFGGYCSYDDCYNNISQLDSETLIWTNLVGGDRQHDGPMKKYHCGIMPFSSEGEDHLFITGGIGPPPNKRQPNAEYCKVYYGNYMRTNEQHIYNISTGMLI